MQNHSSLKSGIAGFFLNIISSCLGFVIGSVILVVIGIILICVLVFAGDDNAAIKRNSVLKIQLSGIMTEKSNTDDLVSMLGDSDPTVSLESILNAIKAAKTNDNIKGISIEAGLLSADPASLEEIHHALADFKSTKKFVYAYGDHYTQGAYFVCSAADKIVLNPIGQVDWKGLSSQTVFYTDLLAKLGIKMQVFKVGTFKSAVEPYTLTQMSEANRTQVNAFLQDIWQRFVNLTAHQRHLTPQRLNALADKYMGLAPAQELKDCKLVDELMYRDEYIDMLKKKTGTDPDDELRQVSPQTIASSVTMPSAENSIAVIYAAGDIVDVKELGLMSSQAIDATTMDKAIREISKDDNTKAVVIRINSGGGSAYASEQIWHSVKTLSLKKPVVVSMGGIAASGAYYISSAANTIVAEPTTLTGSIGIFGLIPDVSVLLDDKLGLKFEAVKTNRMADLGNVSRPFNEDESRLMQSYIDNGYKLFLKRVADGRNKTMAQVDSIAQGRVWTGRQAKQIGLVDQLGGLQTAIDIAARLAKIQKDNYTITSYPKEEPWYTSIGMSQAQAQMAGKAVRTAMGDLYEPLSALHSLSRKDRIQARLPYIIKID